MGRNLWFWAFDCLVATCCEAKYENIPGTRVQAAAGRKQKFRSNQPNLQRHMAAIHRPAFSLPLGRWPTRPCDHTGGGFRGWDFTHGLVELVLLVALCQDGKTFDPNNVAGARQVHLKHTPQTAGYAIVAMLGKLAMDDLTCVFFFNLTQEIFEKTCPTGSLGVPSKGSRWVVESKNPRLKKQLIWLAFMGVRPSSC